MNIFFFSDKTNILRKIIRIDKEFKIFFEDTENEPFAFLFSSIFNQHRCLNNGQNTIPMNFQTGKYLSYFS